LKPTPSILESQEFKDLEEKLNAKDDEIDELKEENRKLKASIKSMKDEHTKREEDIMHGMKTLVDNKEQRGGIKPNHVNTPSFDISDLSEKIERLQRELEERMQRDERTILELIKNNREMEEEIATLRTLDQKRSGSTTNVFHLKNRTLSAQPRFSIRSLFANMSRHNSGIIFLNRNSNTVFDIDENEIPDQLKVDRSGSSYFSVESDLDNLVMIHENQEIAEVPPINEISALDMAMSDMSEN